jgi:hypothetical protein
MNLFLTQREADVLPWRVAMLGDYNDLIEAAEAEPFRPITTAEAEFDSDATEDELVEEVEYFVTLLGFITRSPVFSGWLEIHGDGWTKERFFGLPKFEKRGLRMFRNPPDLARFFDAAWPLRLDHGELDERRLVEALEWHAFGRGGHSVRYLEMQVAPHWIALEVLASAWAQRTDKGELLNNELVAAAKKCLKQILTDAGFTGPQRDAVYRKLGELRRRPIGDVVLDFLRELLGPYAEAQPRGSELEDLIDEANDSRNFTLHQGSLRLAGLSDKEKEAKLAMIQRLECLVERVLLAEFVVPLELLTAIAWTDTRVAA